MKIKVLLFGVLLILVSCKESSMMEEYGVRFYFKEPQPVNDSDLKSFPAKYRGIYATTDDVRKLYIDEKDIYYKYLLNGEITKSELETLTDSVIYKKGKLTVISPDESVVYDTEEKGDTIFFHKEIRDTVFSLSEKHKAKRFKGQLVLSEKDSVFWLARILSIHKDTLYWKYFKDKSDFMKLKALVDDIRTDEDTLKVYLNPSRKEFAKILSVEPSGYNKYPKKKG
ncbi:hypothetical protein ABS768_00040 [Flavobacterium sp. ST-75]|uniref:Lipoprotein n=1 Tax=Flavobacterium rhizophilum TaxID=3163296 RepID=A0ABW8Y9C2_9FLAO